MSASGIKRKIKSVGSPRNTSEKLHKNFCGKKKNRATILKNATLFLAKTAEQR